MYSIRKDESVVHYCEQTTHICVQEAPVAQEDAERFERLLREAIRSLERERHTSLSQADVAAAMGVGRRALQEWLGRRRTPSSSVALLNLLCLIPNQSERLRLLGIWDDGRGEAPINEGPKKE